MRSYYTNICSGKSVKNSFRYLFRNLVRPEALAGLPDTAWIKTRSRIFHHKSIKIHNCYNRSLKCLAVQGGPEEFLQKVGVTIDFNRIMKIFNSVVTLSGILTVLPIGIGFFIGVICCSERITIQKLL